MTQLKMNWQRCSINRKMVLDWIWTHHNTNHREAFEKNDKSFGVKRLLGRNISMDSCIDSLTAEKKKKATFWPSVGFFFLAEWQQLDSCWVKRKIIFSMRINAKDTIIFIILFNYFVKPHWCTRVADGWVGFPFWFSVHLEKIIFVNLFYYSTYFCFIHGFYCTFWYYSWVSLYYFS